MMPEIKLDQTEIKDIIKHYVLSRWDDWNEIGVDCIRVQLENDTYSIVTASITSIPPNVASNVKS